jgi:hypothetical protein
MFTWIDRKLRGHNTAAKKQHDIHTGEFGSSSKTSEEMEGSRCWGLRESGGREGRG